MTDEEREKKQIEMNARNFAENHFKNASWSKQRTAEEVYLLIVRDGILY